MQFIFDILTWKISITMTFEKLRVHTGQLELAGLVLDESLTVTIQK